MAAIGAQTWTELDAQWKARPGRAVALVPVGSTEAHGPHLPLATDVVIAVAVAQRAAARLADRGFAPGVLPALAYGVTEYAGGFAGTVGIRRETVVALLADVCESLAAQGVRAVALLNHHLEPAHFEAVHAAAAEARRRVPGLVVVAPDHRSKRWGPSLGEEFCRGGSHAGEYETSLVLAAAAPLVRSLRESLPEKPVDLAKAIREGAKNFREIPGGEQAWLGSPAQASVARGNALLEKLAEMTVTTLLEALPA
jgi:creatinine amidohydrolase